MKAARFHAARDIRVEDVAPPGEPGPTQVLVKNQFCGICGTDLHEYLGGPIFIPTAPHSYTGGQAADPRPRVFRRGGGRGQPGDRGETR